MTAVVMPDEEECFLLALLESPDGLDLAEFAWYDAESPDGCYRAWDFQWCLAGETVLYTDKGRQRIQDVVGPVRLLTADQGDRGEWVDAEVRSFGSDRVWDVELERRGQRRLLRATAQHRHFIGVGRADRRAYVERKTFQLEVGDYLQPVTSPVVPLALDREWVQSGIVFGDGTVQGSALVRLYGAKQCLASWFDVEAVSYPHHEARVSAVQVRGLPVEYKTRLPKVGEDKESALWGWLAGYFATDGSVLPDGTCVISSINAEAMFRVRDVATALGVVVSAVGHRSHTSRLPNGKEHSLMDFRVVLRVSDLPQEFFLLEHHRQRAAERWGSVRAVDAWRVVRVEATDDVVPVYCAMVKGTGSFVLDGDILTGNSWYTDPSAYQADQGARALGKTVGVVMRSFALPFAFPGAKMLVTAPELNHLRPLVDEIEKRLLSNWLMREMLPAGKGQGINRQPHWQVRFLNDTQIVSRLPGISGKGVKAQHVISIELDEAQDYPDLGWAELVSTLNRWLPNASWRVHGVPTGVRNRFYDITEGDMSSDEDRQWRVHRPMAMMRPSWSDGERQDNTKIFGGSRATIDYRRNIYGEHGDATHVVFVLHKLMACVDKDSGSTYNNDVYYQVKIEDQMLSEDNPIAAMIELPGTHKHGYEQWETPDLEDGKKGRPRQVGAKDGYSAYYAGADIGLLNHPTEILVFGQRKGSDVLELITRIHLRRCDIFQHGDVADILFDFYGEKLKAFALDETGQGQGVFQVMKKKPYKDRIYGYNFSEKVIVGFEDRELTGKETMEDLAQMRNVVEHATDVLRNDYVDTGRLRLPMDGELLKEWQGQTWYFVKDDKDPYGKGRAKDFCVDESTEIMTDGGWKRHDELSGFEQVLVLRPDGLSYWEPLVDVHRFAAEPREMWLSENRGHSSLTTRDHRWLVEQYRAYHRDFVWQWRTSDELVQFSGVPLAAPCASLPDVAKYSDDLVELAGWYMAEGNLNGNQVSLSQSPTVNPEGVARIRRCLVSLFGDPAYVTDGGLWHEYPKSSGVIEFKLCKPAGDVLSEVVTTDEKVPTAEFIMSLTRAQLLLFWDGFYAGDGVHSLARLSDGYECKVEHSVFQKSPARIRMAEMVCALLGMPTNTTSPAADGLNLCVRNQRRVRPAQCRELVIHEGMVWCPQTPSGTWLARRNGTVYFTGNSRGKYHSLDAGKMMAAGKTLPVLEEAAKAAKPREPIIDYFLGQDYM